VLSKRNCVVGSPKEFYQAVFYDSSFSSVILLRPTLSGDRTCHCNTKQMEIDLFTSLSLGNKFLRFGEKEAFYRITPLVTPKRLLPFIPSVIGVDGKFHDSGGRSPLALFQSSQKVLHFLALNSVGYLSPCHSGRLPDDLIIPSAGKFSVTRPVCPGPLFAHP